MIIIISETEVHFAGIGLQARRILERFMRKFEATRGMIVALPVDVSMDAGQETPGGDKRWVPFHCLLQKPRSLGQLLTRLNLI